MTTAGARTALALTWFAWAGCARDTGDGDTGTFGSSDGETEPAPSVDAGWQALRYGDYVGSGVPADLWFDLVGVDPSNTLDRDGRSADLSVPFNLFAAPNGVEVVGGVTCFGCHAGRLDGELVLGLGNPRVDFVDTSAGDLFDVLSSLVDARYGADSPEALAYLPFARGSAAVSAAQVVPFFGVNPAFSIERAAVAHRDPATLAWSDAPLFDVPTDNIWSDTPAWWNLRKRQTLYYTGFGTGAKERMLMQIGVVGLADASQAEDVLHDFDDILAWIEAVEPPVYPLPVDPALADAGAELFAARCAACHGTYGDAGETYPELRVPTAEVGTDPVYAEAFTGAFTDWLASSWFAVGDGDPGEPAYVAPPLDGVWATAPYLHNGSVPDLASLLDPSARPARWRRDPVDSSLDYDKMGIRYTVPADADVDVYTYDTAVRGAGNGGHTYAADLSPDDHDALLAYLRTL